MAHTIILSIESTPSQALNAEPDEKVKMERSYAIDHRDTPEVAGRKAGKRITEMLRQMGHHHED